MAIVRWLRPALLLAASAGLLLFPGAWRLRQVAVYRPTTVNGVTSLRDAIHNCRQTGLSGWSLVAHTQQLVARKLAIYSALNLWDPPGHAFVVGMGYCTQYNLALRSLLEHLGFDVQTVFSLKVKMLDGEAWNMGHTWLRVTIGGETRDEIAATDVPIRLRPLRIPVEELTISAGPANLAKHSFGSGIAHQIPAPVHLRCLNACQTQKRGACVHQFA